MSNQRPATGYIASRDIAGSRAPQHIQNLVIREYCKQRGLAFRLSATEYAPEHCYMMLEKMLVEFAPNTGIVAYSMFMLPARAERRREIYAKILEKGGSLHAAIEDLTLASEADIARWEDILTVAHVLDGQKHAIAVGE